MESFIEQPSNVPPQRQRPPPEHTGAPLDVDAIRVGPGVSGGTGNQMSEYPEGQEPEYMH